MIKHEVIRQFGRSLAILSGLFLIGTVVDVTAIADTPVIVVFDAAISEIDGDLQPLGLPFTMNIGDRLEGKIIFDSREEALSILDGNLTLFADLELNVGDIAIANLFNIGTSNDGGFIGPIDDIDNPPSSIHLGYFPTSMGTPGWVGSGLFPIPWTAEILMVGEPGTIEKPEGLLDFDDWNRLERMRDLTILFGFPDTVTITATLGDFNAVPEPSSIGIFISALIAAILRRQSR